MSEYQYSIKDLENFTQIKSHTIRIWEQRYGLLTPSRTDTNIRYYGETDFKKILNIKLLYAHGIKISKIASFSDEQIIEKAKSIILNAENETERRINEVTLLILNFEKETVLKYLIEESEKQNLVSLYLNFILPLLSKMGEMWQVNAIQIIHEHFFSYEFRAFVLDKIGSLPDPPKNSPKVILFLHDNEEHEFSVLMYYYILKELGFNCYYFGQKVPVKEIEIAQGILNPELIITTFTTKLSEKSFEKIANSLNQMSDKSTVVISGSQLLGMNISIPKKINHIHTVDDLTDLIQQISKN